MSRPSSRSTLSLKRSPFLFLTAALVLGILIDRWTDPPGRVDIALIAGSTAAAIGFLLRRTDRAASLALLAAIVAVGMLLSQTERSRPSDSTRLKTMFETRLIVDEEPVELTGLLTAPPEPAPGAVFLSVGAETVRLGLEVTRASGSARLMLALADQGTRDEFLRLGLDYGSRIRVFVRLERARSFSNPGSPDFNEFLERQGYDLKGTVKSPLLIERLGRLPANPLLSALYHIRLSLIEAIDSRFDPPVAGTLKAMLAGNRYFLDEQVAGRLREGATFHTLVISGFHVGIIAWVLLGGRTELKRWRATRIALVLLVLWAYAVMVGLAPPVSRAAVMITVGLTGPLVFRRAASINTLALAAFAMLALEPALVADPGFQLSFVAVAAIVSIAIPLSVKLRSVADWRPSAATPHPPDCSAWVRAAAETLYWNQLRFEEETRHSPVHYRLDKCRAARVLGRLHVQALIRSVALLLLTSLAIQLMTLPLMVFYFNRVAPVGVLLNVVAGVLTGIIMIASLAAIAAGFLSPWLATAATGIVRVAHDLLVDAIVPFSSIPGATFRAAHYEGWHALVYALYFVPFVVLVVLIDRWRPVEQMIKTDRSDDGERGRNGAAGTMRRGDGATLRPGDEPPSPFLVRVPALPGLRVRRSRNLWLAASLVGCAVAVAAAISPPSRLERGKLTVHFLDVGQGDSALIVFPGGSTMLIDGGGEFQFARKERDGSPPQSPSKPDAPRESYAQPDSHGAEADFRDYGFSVGEAVVSRFLWSLGQTHVDYVLVTHAHVDHIGGLSHVVENFRLGEAVSGPVPERELQFDRFAAALERRTVPLGVVTAGDRFEIEGVLIEVLWPRRAGKTPITSGNNDSVVLRLSFGSKSILLTGDIEQAGEEALLQSGVELRADVLKVPHHGSKTSSTNHFIESVNPKFAVISVGQRSRFGHPSQAVVERYLARGIQLLRTGRDGTVTVETDGSILDVKPFRD